MPVRLFFKNETWTERLYLTSPTTISFAPREKAMIFSSEEAEAIKVSVRDVHNIELQEEVVSCTATQEIIHYLNLALENLGRARSRFKEQYTRDGITTQDPEYQRVVKQMNEAYNRMYALSLFLEEVPQEKTVTGEWRK